MSETAPTVARYITVGGAHVVISGVIKDFSVALDCEGCGHHAGPFYRVIYSDPPVRSFRRAQADAQKHAETCRSIPKRLWPKAGAR